MESKYEVKFSKMDHERFSLGKEDSREKTRCTAYETRPHHRPQKIFRNNRICRRGQTAVGFGQKLLSVNVGEEVGQEERSGARGGENALRGATCEQFVRGNILEAKS